MKKQSYFTSVKTDDRTGIVAKYVSGYVVEKVVAGAVMRLGIHKEEDSKLWTVIDLATGLAILPGHKFGKRAEALAFVEDKDEQTGKSLAEMMEGYLERKPHSYKAQCMAFDIIKYRNGDPWAVREYTDYISKKSMELMRAAAVEDREQDAGELAEKVAERSPEARALMDEGKMVVIDMTAENGAKARVAKGADGKPMAVAVEEHHDMNEDEKEEPSMESKRIAELEAEVEQLRKKAERWVKRAEENKAELSKARAELERVWKENEVLKASQRPQEAAGAPKSVPPAPKPPKAAGEPQEAARTVAAAAIAVTLEYMEAWAAERGLLATQKREGCCIWVEGDSKPYADELKELGFKFTGKRKSWYFDPKSAKSAA